MLCLLSFSLLVCSKSTFKFIVAVVVVFLFVPCEISHRSLKSPLCQYHCELPVLVRGEFVTEKEEFFPTA